MFDGVPLPSRKRLLAGCRVSGSFGVLIPNPDSNKKRCIHKRLLTESIGRLSQEKIKLIIQGMKLVIEPQELE